MLRPKLTFVVFLFEKSGGFIYNKNINRGKNVDKQLKIGEK